MWLDELRGLNPPRDESLLLHPDRLYFPGLFIQDRQGLFLNELLPICIVEKDISFLDASLHRKLEKSRQIQLGEFWKESMQERLRESVNN